MSALAKFKASKNGSVGDGHHSRQNGSTNRLPPSDEKSNCTTFEFLDSATFSAGDYRPEWLVKGVLVKNEPVVAAGASKTLKTSITAVDLGISLACGLPFLGRFEVPHAMNVVIASGESGKGTLQETAHRICKAKGTTLSSIGRCLNWCFTVPVLSDLEAMTVFVDGLAERDTKVVVLDPLYLALGNVDAKNMFETGAVLRFVATLLIDRGITPVILHHANRKNSTFEPMELTDIAYSGCDQFARQFLLVSRREKYAMDGNHKLWLKIGGSAGHGGLFAVDVCEGITGDDFKGRKWDVTVDLPAEMKATQYEQKERYRADQKRIKASEDDQACLKAISEGGLFGQAAVTKAKIKERSGISRDRVDEAVSRLLEEEKIVLDVYESQRGGGAKVICEGFRLRKEGESPTPKAAPFI